MLDRNNINNFIISFCCSGQTTLEGTWLCYRYMGIDKSQVINMQYRGNGWPSGIQIELFDGKKYIKIILVQFINPKLMIKKHL